MSEVPKYLYHITNSANIYSIIQYGLGAKIGKGIDLHLSQKDKIYSIDFDPEIYFRETLYTMNETQKSQLELLLRICILIAFDSKYLKFCIIKINTDDIDKTRLVKTEEDFIFIYYGKIEEYDISGYEMIDSNKIKFFIMNEDSSYHNIYFKKIL
jgi:hypothetical protein